MLLPLLLLSSRLLHAASAPEFPPHAAEQIIGGALSDGHAYQRLVDLTDQVGPRLSGSPGAAAAVKWALARFKAEGLNAHLEPAKATHWIRGMEKASLLVATDPIAEHALAVTALGNSGSTPAEGVTADVVEVRSLEELTALGEKVRGKIVFFNHAMAVPLDYRTVSPLRGYGPKTAQKLGAVGVLVRSLATASMRTPHTGNTSFEKDQPHLASVAVSLEDAELLHRTLARGVARVHLTVHAENLPEADSSNVVAEIKGREHPEQVVVFGAHLDSWDLATGAQDDAAGVTMVMEAAELIARMKPAPRRTVRFVLFMDEESGGGGGRAYAATHAAELPKHVGAIEADIGSGRPLGVGIHAGEGGGALVTEWARPLQTLGGAELKDQEAGGSDIGPLAPAGVPFVGVKQDAALYFDIHHSAADTVDRVKPLELAQSAAAYAWLTYAMAESPRLLPRAPPPPPKPPAH